MVRYSTETVLLHWLGQLLDELLHVAGQRCAGLCDRRLFLGRGLQFGIVHVVDDVLEVESSGHYWRTFTVF